MNTTHAALVGVPLDLGGASLGVDIAPQIFRNQHITQKLATSHIIVDDLGDIAITPRTDLSIGDPHLKYATEIIRVSEELATKTSSAIQAGNKAIVLGGDHSVCLGAVAGASTALQGDIGVIYFDAHGDMNTHVTTPTGNIHGMHLASLMGFGEPSLVNIHGTGAKLAPQNLLHIGGSDLDDAERDLIARENLTAFTLFDLLTKGISPLINLIDNLTAQVSNIWISLDLDCIDEMYAPGAGMPNKKGLLYREIATLAEYIGKKCNVVGIDVVEYNPHQDIDYKTAELSIELIATFFGRSYSWYTGYLEQNKI